MKKLITRMIKAINGEYLNNKSCSRCSKQWIKDSMTEKYGEDWLEQCIEGLKDPSVRADLKETLKL